MKDSLLALVKSRKFMLAVFGVINTLVAYYFDVPTEVWGSINGLILSVILGITAEDYATKSNICK